MEVETIARGGDQLQDGGAKWRQIMDGARTVFLSEGFDGASMNDIARVAGVSKGTLYVYFDSKEKLFEALIRYVRAQQAERLVDFGDSDDPEIYLRRFAVRLMEVMTRPESLAHLRVVIAAAAKFPRLGQVFYEAGPLYGVRKLAARLERFRASGALRFDDAEQAAHQFLALAKARIFNEALFRVVETIPRDKIERSVELAVSTFLYACEASPRARS